MAVTKSESFGCTVLYGEASAAPVVGDATDTLGQVSNIDGPGWSMDTVNVTTNDNTDLMEYIAAGIADGGECTMTVVLDPTAAAINGADGVVAELEAGVKQVVKITFTGDADVIWFPCIFTGLKIVPGPQDGTADKLTAELSMKVTENLTIA